MGTLVEDRSLRNQRYVFKDRAEAGRWLAQKLSHPPPDAIVFAIPAGGVPVACEIARDLKLSMDLMIVKKYRSLVIRRQGLGRSGRMRRSFLTRSF